MSFELNMPYFCKVEIFGRNMYWSFYLFDYEFSLIGKFIIVNYPEQTQKTPKILHYVQNDKYETK